MGPPCPTCGQTLTWFPQNNAWGCDRCRVMLSPQQVQPPPQQQPPPQPQYPAQHAQYPQAPAQYQPANYQQPPQAPPPLFQPAPQYQQPIPKTIPINTFEQQQQSAAQLQAYPQAQGYPQAYAQPQATAAPAQVRPGGKNTKVLIATGIGVVIAAGAAIAFVVTRGGSDSIGVSSRDELVKATFKSLGAGDVDGLMKRTGMPGVKKYFTCDKDKADSQHDAKELAEIREEIARATARLRGATIKVGKISGPEKPEVMAKGTELGEGCKLDTPMESHSLTVQLDILHANGTEEKQQAEMQVAKIAGRWIFTGAPTIPGCNAAIARVAQHGAAETKAFDTVNGLQVVLMSRCLEDAWGPTVLKCLEASTGVSDAKKCLATLTPKELAPLIKEVDAALAAAPSTAKELRQILPDAVEDKPPVADVLPPPPATPVDPDTALVEDTLVLDVAPPDPSADDPGRPEQGEQADFWLWTRSDNSVRVTSPVVKAVFPGRPEQKLEKGNGKTLDGKDVWLYQFVFDLGDDGQLRLELSGLGRNAGGSDKEPLVPLLAKIGKVKRKKSVVDGIPIVDLEAVEASSGGSLRAHVIRDLKRGLMIVAVATTSPKTRAVGTKFLASVSEVMGADPIEDPQLLADLVVKKVKKKYAVATSNGDFSIELPHEPKIKRTGPQPGKSLVMASIVAESKKSQISLQISEHASWDALGFHPPNQEVLANDMKAMLEKKTGTTMVMTPGRLAGMMGYSIDQAEPAKPKVQFRMLFNRYQHRTFILFCIDAGCDAAVSSMKFADPSAE